MKPKYLIKTSPLWLLPLLFTPHAVYSQATVFSEHDGFVFFEAESALPAASAWALQDELPNFSGDGYIEWTGPDLFAASGAGQGVLTYTFEITNPGNYELRWRTHIAKGESNTESNDSWVRFPTGVNIAGEQGIYGWSKVFMGHFGAWFWDAKVVDHVGANVRQYFSAGTHTMEVSGRSFGHAIDKMALFKYEELSLSPNDLDIRTGTPQASIVGNQAIVDGVNNPQESSVDTGSADNPPVTEVNALQIPTGINQAPGECVNERLALAAEADIHLLGSQSFDASVLLVAPEPAQALLRFDLGNVPPAVSAELQLSVISGEGEATFSTHLVDGVDWSESAGTLGIAPGNVLLLQENTAVWSAGLRYALPLQVAGLPAGPLTLSLAANGLQQPLQLASRENSLNMPVLLLLGENGFCETYRAAGMPDEMEEVTQPTVTEDSAATSSSDASGLPDAAVQTTLVNEQANQQSSSGGSGGGALLWLSLPLVLLLSFARQADRRKKER